VPLRAGFYFDGFNIYHAIDERGDASLKWTCYMQMAMRLVEAEEEVELVKVFTALPWHKPNSTGRHSMMTDIWKANGCDVIFGSFKEVDRECKYCGEKWIGHSEKESDVNLSCHLLIDSLLDRIDVAYIVTADSDIAAAVKMVKAQRPNVQMVCVSPPGKPHCKEIRDLTSSRKAKKLYPNMLKQCRLGVEVEAGGILYTRPTEYDPGAEA
jgi:hypothetical protein